MDASTKDLLEALGRVSRREEQRAYAEFKEQHGREYDGSSDDDWDDLDKDYCAVDEAMNAVRENATRAQAA